MTVTSILIRSATQQGSVGPVGADREGRPISNAAENIWARGRGGSGCSCGSFALTSSEKMDT